MISAPTAAISVEGPTIPADMLHHPVCRYMDDPCADGSCGEPTGEPMDLMPATFNEEHNLSFIPGAC